MKMYEDIFDNKLLWKYHFDKNAVIVTIKIHFLGKNDSTERLEYLKCKYVFRKCVKNQSGKTCFK